MVYSRWAMGSSSPAPKTSRNSKSSFLDLLPEQAQDQMTGNGNRSLPYPDELLGPPLPEYMDSLNESRIAKQIASLSLLSLRVIVVDSYKHWIQPSATNKSFSKVWFLQHALQDPEQENEIS